MKKFLIAFGVFLVLLVAALFIAPSLIPSSVYKDKIQTQLSEELGRDVRITGDVKLSAFPVVKAKTGAVEVDNPTGFSQTEFIRLNALEARVKLLPLFSKRVEITKFTLIEPKIYLEKRADGTTNWAMGDASDPAPDTGPFKRDGRMAALDPQISAFNLENGTVTYLDQASQKSISVTDINTFVSMPGMSKSLIVDGSLNYDGTPVTLDMSLNSPRAFLDGQSAAIKGTAKTDFADVKIDGEFLPGEAIALAANIDANVSDMKAFQPFLGEMASYAAPVNQAAITGDIRYINGVTTANNTKLTANGPSVDVAFNGDAKIADSPDIQGSLTAKLTDMSVIAPYLKDNAKYLKPLSAIDFKGDVSTNGTVHKVKKAALAVKGPDIDVNFNGDALVDGAPSATGMLSADIRNMQAIKPFLPNDIKGLEEIGSASVKADLQAKDKGFTAKTLTATVKGPELNGDFNGTASYGDILTAQGNFSAKAANPAKLASIFAPDVTAAAALGATDVKGQLSLNDKDITLSQLTLNTDGDNLDGNFTGDVTMKDGQATAQGQFKADIVDIPALAKTAGMTIANVEAVKTARATGSINFSGTTAQLSNLDAALTNGPLNGTYKGGATLGDIPAFDGTFTAKIPNLSAVDQAIAMDVPYADAIGKIDVSGKIKGAGKAIDITGLVADLADGSLNGSYRGSARYSDGLTLNGALDTVIPSLRDLAQQTGTQLPPSTKDGDIFGKLALSGNVSGTPEKITLSDAKLGLDQIAGNGTFGIDLKGAKPVLSGNLDLPSGLDLRPYMAAYSAQKPEGEIQPWSEAPINVEPLRAIDGKIVVTTPNIKTGRMNLGQTTINTTLANGVLSADMPNLSLYGGRGTMTATLNANNSVPQIAIDANLNALQTNSFLSALAGFSNASGEGQTLVKIRGQGASQAAIMRSLNGDGGFKVVEGAVQGVNVSEFMTGLNSALTSRSLPSGIGPGQITKFQDMIGDFNIENGVVKIGKFKLQGLNILAEGDGTIDLGNQSIDFRLLPKLTGEQASGLAAFGIPIRFSGGFGSAKAGLDTEFLGQIVAAKARAEVQDRIQDEIGGNLGGVLGGILGGGQPQQPTETPAPDVTPPATETPQAEPARNPTPEDILGGLLGVKKPAPQPEETLPEETLPEETLPEETKADEPKEEPKKEPTLEDALGGLFGKKKSD